MRTNIFLLVLIMGLFSCSKGKNEKQQMIDEIQQLETKLAKQESDTLDLGTARLLIRKSEIFADSFPQDSMSGNYLFKAADVARGIGDYITAVNLWNKVYNEYRNLEKAPEALFLIAFTFDKDVKNVARAKRGYQNFIRSYPNHDLKADAKLLLEYLDAGKTPEELIEEFKKNIPQ